MIKILLCLYIFNQAYAPNYRTTNNLLFTVPEQTLKTAQGAVNKRFTFNLLFPWTSEEITALFDGIDVIVSSWKNLGFFSDETIKRELYNQLDNGMGVFNKVRKYFDYFKKLLSNVNPQTKKSKCTYNLEFVNKGFYTNTSIFLTNMWSR